MDASLATAAPEKKDWRVIAETILRSPYFVPTAIFAVGLTIVYWPLLSYLYPLWTGPDGYYTHGFLVPLIVGYLIFKAWPKLKETPIKSTAWPLLLLPPIMWVAYAARLAELRSILSIGFIATILIGICFIFGTRWMWRLCLPTLYLLFAFPIWSGFVTNYTNPLQQYSTVAAYKILELFSHPIKTNTTTILVGNFWLDVGVPCSGLKLILALSAFTTFFMLVGGLKFWANIVMAFAIFPLCLFINGLRIAMIGLVGDHYGDKAGIAFHDYSGYIALLVCFFILFKLARWLGWKD
jgi:exosortase